MLATSHSAAQPKNSVKFNRKSVLFVSILCKQKYAEFSEKDIIYVQLDRSLLTVCIAE